MHSDVGGRDVIQHVVICSGTYVQCDLNDTYCAMVWCGTMSRDTGDECSMTWRDVLM